MNAGRIPFIDPKSGKILHLIDNNYCLEDGKIIASVIDRIPRFVESAENYAENFGIQWNHWQRILSDSQMGGKHKNDLILKRTQFNQFDLEGKTLLECGCGGGDDTEVLLGLPFKEVHSFDISNAVDRAKKNLGSPGKLILSQASIMEIPYPDESFDFVFCHRVIMHTPSPLQALRSIMKKVKPGGVIFVHSYHRSRRYMQNYKYKYRYITKQLPPKWIMRYVNWFGVPMHHLNKVLSKTNYSAEFARRFVPFEFFPSYSDFDESKLITLEKLVTFDALTPTYDIPISWEEMRKTVVDSNFEVLYAEPNPNGSPIYLTAQKN